ncbi:MAG: Conjugal transfer protein TrbG/VirB9/CagX [Ramlibacter sp.]|nr:Conjugal transfer protein TrbG/VirB9/CagX [Ramlibacter sp.]
MTASLCSGRRRVLARTGLVACLALACCTASGELVATPLRGDTRLVQFVYDADNTYLVLAKPKAVTHLQFAPNETIRSVAAGDSANWELTPTRDRRNLFLKPRFDGEETSMTVLTDQRAYQFVLRSTGEGRKWYQRVSWSYGNDLVRELQGEPLPAPTPEMRAAVREAEASPAAPAGGAATALGALRPETLRFQYEIRGDAPFKPQVVFDDGRFTYFKLPANLQELPALFAVVDGKDFSLVNFDLRGEYLVAQRLLEAAVLKLGSAEVRIEQVRPARRNPLGWQSQY